MVVRPAVHWIMNEWCGMRKTINSRITKTCEMGVGDCESLHGVFLSYISFSCCIAWCSGEGSRSFPSSE
jgi:hypothetical protein